MDTEQGFGPKLAAYRVRHRRSDGKKDWQQVNRIPRVRLNQLRAVWKNASLTAIVGRGGRQTLTPNAALR